MIRTSAKKDLVILGRGRWDLGYGSTAISMSRALAAHHRVFYIEPAFSWKEKWLYPDQTSLRFRKGYHGGKQAPYFQLPGDPANLFYLVPPLRWPTQKLPDGGLYQFLMKRNHRRMAVYLQWAADYFDWQHPTVINFQLAAYPFSSLGFTPAQKVYYAVDRLEAAPYLQKHEPRWEVKSAAEADLVVATSKWLRHHFSEQRSDEVLYLPNGAEVKLFEQAVDQRWDRPFDLPPKGHPILLYIGMVSERLDIALLGQLLQQHPEFHLVMIGPQKAGPGLEILQKQPRVHLLPPKSQFELLPYLAHARCGLIPFCRSPLTEAMYPLKIHEYLAAGLPVVSTPFSPDLEDLLPHISLAHDPQRFAAQVYRKVYHDTPDHMRQRRLFAQQHAWTQKSEQLLDAMATHQNGQNHHLTPRIDH
ncbi:MAG: glycosyltransferase [Bacteroidota bacterium]